jgi:hypothetical protein
MDSIRAIEELISIFRSKQPGYSFSNDLMIPVSSASLHQYIKCKMYILSRQGKQLEGFL